MAGWRKSSSKAVPSTTIRLRILKVSSSSALAAASGPVPSTTIRLRILKVNSSDTWERRTAGSIYHDPFEDTERLWLIAYERTFSGSIYHDPFEDTERAQRVSYYHAVCDVPSTTIRLRILKDDVAQGLRFTIAKFHLPRSV